MSATDFHHHFIAKNGESITRFDIFSDCSAYSHHREKSDIQKTAIILEPKTRFHHILIHHDQIHTLYPDAIRKLNVEVTHLSKPTHTMHLDIHQDIDSFYQATVIASGDHLNHLSIQNYLSGKSAQSDIRILKYGHSKQKISVETTAHHIAAHTVSRTIARGIMDDEAKGSFTGKIIVSNAADKTEAKLEDKNILLSKHAEMNTRPLLEVYNGNIQCSHGATVGYLDEEALFYLRSRGIPQHEAKTMLVKAFLSPALQHLTIHPDWLNMIEGLFV